MGVLRDSEGLFGDDPFGAEAQPAPEADPGRVLTVSELSRTIQSALHALGRVRVEGEISRVTRAASGHLYFDLKDLDAKLACTIWRSALPSALRFELEEGQRVVAHGKLDVWAPRGSYSLIVQRLEPRGLGALLLELEQLKESLRARGWFERHRPLPRIPRRVVVVTSRDGAALQDFLRTRTQRWPGFPARLVHTLVQGKGAAREIAAAIARADADCDPQRDVIAVIRGGGSLEDLWAFNELPVAEAVWNAKTPLVSGVGHQTDTTLIDLVADLRAHTPTDAAQSVIPARAELVERLDTARARLDEATARVFEVRQERLRHLGRAPGLSDAQRAFALRRERLASLADALRRELRRRLADASGRLATARSRLWRASPLQHLAQRASRLELLHERLRSGAARRLDREQRGLALQLARLESLAPQRVLERGFTITRRAGVRGALDSAAGLAPGELLETQFAAGTVRSRVTEPGSGA